jgi:signal peptidase I
MLDRLYDFGLILTLATAATGAVWALDRGWLGPRRRAGLAPGAEDKPNAFVDFCRSFFPVILFVLLLRTFLVEPFRIPSGSMMPTLLSGDFILVNKFAYGLRDPVFHRTLFGIGRPQRGDVVVFRPPHQPHQNWIKRVVGLPGDRIAYRNKWLSVNGEAVQLDSEGLYAGQGLSNRLLETYEGVSHEILTNSQRPAEDFEFDVPAGHYFMMGDNRDGSDDSRFWGPLPEANLVGKAFFIWMSWDTERFRPAWSRIGNPVR